MFNSSYHKLEITDNEKIITTFVFVTVAYTNNTYNNGRSHYIVQPMQHSILILNISDVFSFSFSSVVQPVTQKLIMRNQFSVRRNKREEGFRRVWRE